MMKLTRFHLLTTFVFLLSFSTLLHAAKYHIASQDDFDRLKTSQFLAGDQILFKRGSRFIGMFAPTGQGTPQAPILISTYGKGNRPIINAKGKHEAGLLLLNISFWEINGLEITNPYKNLGPEPVPYFLEY